MRAVRGGGAVPYGASMRGKGVEWGTQHWMHRWLGLSPEWRAGALEETKFVAVDTCP